MTTEKSALIFTPPHIRSPLGDRAGRLRGRKVRITPRPGAPGWRQRELEPQQQGARVHDVPHEAGVHTSPTAEGRGRALPLIPHPYPPVAYGEPLAGEGLARL